MKNLKLNQLEKSEMNEVRGGDFVCAQYCTYQCQAIETISAIKENPIKGTPPSKTINMKSRMSCFHAVRRA